MTILVSRRLARYAILSTVVLLVIWTARSSHTDYHILTQPTSWLGQGDQAAVMITETTTEQLICEFKDEEAPLRVGQKTTTTSSLQAEQTIGETKGLLDMSSTATHLPETEPAREKDGWTSNQKKQAQIVLEDVTISEPEGQNITSTQIQAYVESILDLNMTTMERLACPGEMMDRLRYEVLRNKHKSKAKIKYLFAMDLVQAVDILPRLIGTVVQVAKFLGPENCGLSIVEGRSTDGTFSVLEDLKEPLSKIEMQYWLQQSDIDPKHADVDRVEALARLRNKAIEPLLNETKLFSEKPLVVFINDIVPCPDDIYEMIYQHQLQNAVQTCAMDWIENGENFYDIWVSRSMTGDTFWEVPQDGSWVFVRNLFFDDPFTRDKYTRGVPFQVFSCWGGMTVIDGLPFIHDSLRIRRNFEGECYGGEPQMLGSDLAKLGISRVQTLPAVNVGYTNEEGLQVKKLRKYVHERVDVEKLIEKFEDDSTTERIKWKPPPSKIRCMPDFHDRWWVDTWYDPSRTD